jgi:hypothetical protein
VSDVKLPAPNGDRFGDLSDANWDALREIAQQTNQRLPDAQLDACQCAPDADALRRVVLSSSHDGQPAPGLRFGDPRVMALLASLCAFSHLIDGFTNRSLRTLIAGLIPGYSARQMTYDLRRLRRKGLIRRIPRSHRYQLADHGRRTAVFFTQTYTRIVNPSLAELDPTLPDPIARRTPLGRSWRAFEHALDHRITDGGRHAFRRQGHIRREPELQPWPATRWRSYRCLAELLEPDDQQDQNYADRRHRDEHAAPE